jgi:Pyruvate/2-oxoacid:ferredoxin oxidoreductase gamma subunit
MLGGMAALGNTGVLVENYRIALKKNLPEKLLHQNLRAFKLGHDAVTALLATN